MGTGVGVGVGVSGGLSVRGGTTRVGTSSSLPKRSQPPKIAAITTRSTITANLGCIATLLNAINLKSVIFGKKPTPVDARIL